MRPPPRKKTGAGRWTRARRVKTYPRPMAERKLPSPPPVTLGARDKNRFRKLTRKTGTRFSRRRKNDNWITEEGGCGHLEPSLALQAHQPVRLQGRRRVYSC